MSFDKQKETVEEGDTVILYFGRNNLNPLDIDIKCTYQSKFGAFHHKDIIGKKYGSKVQSKKGWGYILRPTPELWTVSLPHRTQILYSMDISMITFELELHPGSIVVEAGTGSGSLSHAIIRSTKPTGHLYTFDFHQNRVLKAEEEFSKHYGPGKYVTSACADVCANGFSLTDTADAVFLDLPTPWDAIPHAKTALKKSGGRICSFSPCIEQVQRTSIALRKARFCEIKTLECLIRPLQVHTVPIPEMVFDCDLSKLESEEETEAKKQRLDVVGSEKNHQNTSEDGNCLEDIKECPESIKTAVLNSEECPMNTHSAEVDNNKIGIKSEEDTNSLNNDSSSRETLSNNTDGPKCKTESKHDNKIESSPDPNDKKEEITGLNSLGMLTKVIAKSKKGNVNMVTCKPIREVTGHTGYLTFASLLPSVENV